MLDWLDYRQSLDWNPKAAAFRLSTYVAVATPLWRTLCLLGLSPLQDSREAVKSHNQPQSIVDARQACKTCSEGQSPTADDRKPA